MRLICLLWLLVASSTCLAEQLAVTDTGDQVMLYDNGTWSYLDKNLKVDAAIPTNSRQFKKADNATFLLKSKVNDSAFWLDTSKWQFAKAGPGGEAEYELDYKKGDVFGLVITEEVPFGLEGLSNLAFINAQSAAPDAKVVKKEYRTVNGRKLIHMEMVGTLQGVRFTYIGYYFSDDSGSTQFLAYTASSIIDRYRKDIEELLNGLIVQ